MEINHIPGRILAILWTTASWSNSEEFILITNSNRELLVQIKKFLTIFGFNYSIYSSEEIKRKDSKNEYNYTYFRLKIYNDYIINILRNKYSWRGRKEDKRYYPEFEYERQEKGFLRYYIKDKSSIDRISDTRKRIRVFANWNFIDQLSERTSYFLGTNINKPQSHSQSDKMKVIYYQSQKDVKKIAEFICS